MYVEAVELSKTGKSYRVKMAGKWYTSRAKGIEQAAGKHIEPVYGVYDAPDGSKLETIQVFTYIIEAPAQPAAAPSGPQGTTLPFPVQAGRDRWWMPFVSNTVAHAIAAGIITKPEQITYWAKAAYRAALSVEDPTREPGMDEDPPY